jgi:hypothetical protein
MAYNAGGIPDNQPTGVEDDDQTLQRTQPQQTTEKEAGATASWLSTASALHNDQDDAQQRSQAARSKTTTTSLYPNLMQPSHVTSNDLQQAPAQNYTHRTTSSAPITDAIAVVKLFTGRGYTTADDWFNIFQRYVKYKQLSAADRLALFGVLMSDSAAEWLSELPPHITSTEANLYNAFHTRFGLSDGQRWRLETDLWSRKQRSDESVDEFVTDIKKRSRQVGMTPDQALRVARQGLRPEIRQFVINADVRDMETLINIARRNELSGPSEPINQIDALATKLDELVREIRTTNQKQASINAVTGRRPWDPPITQQNRSNDNLQYNRQPIQHRQRMASTASPGLCKFCNRTHIYGRQYCPAAREGATCSKCGKHGHFRAVCTSQTAPTQTQSRPQ